MAEKQKNRWIKEVETMNSLEHVNIVCTLRVPNQLKELDGPLPLLCMEYCSEGDLRSVSSQKIYTYKLAIMKFYFSIWLQHFDFYFIFLYFLFILFCKVMLPKSHWQISNKNIVWYRLYFFFGCCSEMLTQWIDWVSRILIYFDMLNTNMTMKISANDIFNV